MKKIKSSRETTSPNFEAAKGAAAKQQICMSLPLLHAVAPWMDMEAAAAVVAAPAGGLDGFAYLLHASEKSLSMMMRQRRRRKRRKRA